jgi:hypothetical protein
MMRRHLRLAALALAALATTPAWAQQETPVARPPVTPPPEALPDANQPVEPDLYLDALQAISEGRKSDASALLARMVARGARNAGEWLDLAMLQCALGHADEAEQLFNAIETKLQPPKGLLTIIEDQRRQGCAAWQRQQQWGITVARGYDQNVNQGASNPFYSIGDGSGGPQELAPEYLPKPDRYSTVALDYMADLTQNGDLGYVQLYGRRNDSQVNYNTISVFAGADHPWRWQRWRLRASGLIGALTLGGQLYQAQSQLQLRAVPPLPLPPTMELALQTGLTHLNYRTLTNFDSNTSEVRTIFSYRTEARQVQASAGWMRDHAVAARPGGDRSGWALGLSARTALTRGIEAELDWNALHWDGKTAYSPGIIDTVRRQNTRSVRAGLSFALTPTTSVQLEWRQVHNKENISIFQYDNHVFQFSWRWRDGK